MFICDCVQDSAMPHRRRKSHKIRNAVIVIVSLMVIVSLVVVAVQMNGGKAAGLAYSDIYSSSTDAGSMCTFKALWTDNVNLSGYIFETNNTGVFTNDTWVPLSNSVDQTSAYATVTKSLDNTIGDTVQWRFYCNDTNNNWNASSFQTLFIETNKVLLVTSMGSITIELYDDMPITTGNFKNLVRIKAYDGTIFHRIVPGFVVQGGDVSSKGITVPPIQDELPNKHSNVRGSLAMAKTNSPNSASSQFYINLNDSNAAKLDSNYSVFGTVIAGMDVVDKISQVPINTDSTSPNYDKPLQDVTLISATFIK
jgi:cyclophilin family peptidyl-prolyl cis-trans isomerase